MDVDAKMVELEALWSDSFDLCKALIASCKAGEQKLTGSLLKEINSFVKQSVDFLKYREAEQAFTGEEAEEREDEELKELLESVAGDLDDYDAVASGDGGAGGKVTAGEPIELPPIE